MIKLLIKQGPFYLSSFTALFLAMDQTGWLDRLFPLEEISEPIAEETCFVNEAGEDVCFRMLPMMLESIDFVPEDTPIYQEPWFVVAALIIGTLVLGFLARKVWEFVFE